MAALEALLTTPFEVHPLQPTLVKPFHRPGWVYEEKVDGWRLVAYRAGGQVRLVSRKGVEHSARFPDLVKAIASLRGATLVLDREVAVIDRASICSAILVRRRRRRVRSISPSTSSMGADVTFGRRP
jgi:bifunctional non-homologous end joining protein LigD